jgi:hypothetical protein
MTVCVRLAWSTGCLALHAHDEWDHVRKTTLKGCCHSSSLGSQQICDGACLAANPSQAWTNTRPRFRRRAEDEPAGHGKFYPHGLERQEQNPGQETPQRDKRDRADRPGSGRYASVIG